MFWLCAGLVSTENFSKSSAVAPCVEFGWFVDWGTIRWFPGVIPHDSELQPRLWLQSPKVMPHCELESQIMNSSHAFTSLMLLFSVPKWKHEHEWPACIHRSVTVSETKLIDSNVYISPSCNLFLNLMQMKDISVWTWAVTLNRMQAWWLYYNSPSAGKGTGRVGAA